MMIGIGFGNWWQSLLMLVGTSLASYLLYRAVRGSVARVSRPSSRARLREQMYEQRRRARALAREYDLTDEEIERRIDAICDSQNGPGDGGKDGR